MTNNGEIWITFPYGTSLDEGVSETPAHRDPIHVQFGPGPLGSAARNLPIGDGGSAG